MTWRVAVITVLFNVVFAIVSAQRLPVLPPSEPLAIVGAHLVDVRRGTVIPRVTLIVRDTRIEAIHQEPPPAGVRVLNLPDHYLIPGLIDAHTHLADLDAGRRALESGVTTARSAGTVAYNDVALRDLSIRAAVAVPDVLAAGYGLRPQLPLDTFLASPSYWDLERGLRGPEKVRQAVRMNTARKVDWIKVFATEGIGGDPSKMQFTKADIIATIEEADAHRTPVSVHAFGDEAVRIAVEAGARSIEHGSLMSEETLDVMKRRGTFFVPTAAVIFNAGERPARSGFDDAVIRRNLMIVQPRGRETVQHAHRKGVKIVAGTDWNYGSDAPRGVSTEIANLVQLGLTPLEAIRSATIVSAEMLRLERSVGVLEAGYQADMVAVQSNPLGNVAALRAPSLVVSNGRIALLKSDLAERRRADSK